MARKIQILAETIFVAAISAVFAGVVLSDWFLTCCRPLVAGWTGAILAPGVILGMFIGGGAGRSTALDAGIGITIELMVAWGILRWIVTCRRRVS